MARKILIGILIIAFMLETFLCAGAFFFPEILLKKFGVPYNPDTAFLGFLTAWFLLFVSAICGAAVILLFKNKPCSWLCYLLGFWWVAIGIGIFIAFKKSENLLLDSFKGLLIIFFTMKNDSKKLD